MGLGSDLGCLTGVRVKPASLAAGQLSRLPSIASTGSGTPEGIRIMGKAATGPYDVGVGAAGELLANAIWVFYRGS